MTAAIVAPMCAYTLVLFVLWGALGATRIAGALRGSIPLAYVRVGEGPRPSDRIVGLHHHFSNQFEVPTLFYLGCALLVATGSAGGASVALAWSFVGLRIVHTLIVLANNDPRLRVGPYFLSSLAVWLIWADLFRQVVWAAA